MHIGNLRAGHSEILHVIQGEVHEPLQFFCFT